MKAYNIGEFVELLLSGKSYEELATEYGITRNGIRQRVAKLKKSGYIPEEFDGRKSSRKHLVISKKPNTGVKQPRPVCTCKKCEDCKIRCEAFKVISILVNNGIDLKVRNKIYIANRQN